MRTIKWIVLHCTATVQTATVAAIERYWREVLKWQSPGYHKIILPDGTVVTLATDDRVCNGVAGHNSGCLHVSYVGGIDAKGKAIDNRTPAQRASLEKVVREWKAKHPHAVVQGHRDFLVKGKPGWKECPCFPAKEWWASRQTVGAA